MRTLKAFPHRVALAVPRMSAIFDFSAKQEDMPGVGALKKLINVLAFLGLMACAVGFLLGACQWAIGGRIGNDHAVTGGKSKMLVALGCAFLIGASATLINYAYTAGDNVDYSRSELKDAE